MHHCNLKSLSDDKKKLLSKACSKIYTHCGGPTSLQNIFGVRELSLQDTYTIHTHGHIYL